MLHVYRGSSFGGFCHVDVFSGIHAALKTIRAFIKHPVDDFSLSFVELVSEAVKKLHFLQRKVNQLFGPGLSIQNRFNK